MYSVLGNTDMSVVVNKFDVCNSEFLVWEWSIKLIQGKIIFVGRYKPTRDANVVKEEEMRTSKMDKNVHAHIGH